MQNFASMGDTVFCGVFDGHGPFGHLVARRVRDSVPSKLLHYWEERMAHQAESLEQREISINGASNGTVEKPIVHQNGGFVHRENGAGDGKMLEKSSVHQNGGFVHRENGAEGKMLVAETVDEVKEPPMFEAWKESHLTAYRVMDKELRSHPGIDCFCSGTTAVTVLKQAGIPVLLLKSPAHRYVFSMYTKEMVSVHSIGNRQAPWFKLWLKF